MLYAGPIRTQAQADSGIWATESPSEPEKRPLTRVERRWLFVLALVVAFHVFSLMAAARVTPFTAAENLHLAAAMALRTELSFDAEDTLLQGPIPFYASQLWSWFGAEFESPVQPVEANKVLGRYGMVPLSVLTLLLLMRLTWRQLGAPASTMAGLCYVLTPAVVGFGSLMLPDIAASLGLTLTFCAALHYFRSRGWRRAILLGLALGTACATAPAALLLLPALLIGGSLVLITSPEDDLRSKELLLPLLRDIGVIAAVGVVTLHGWYGFQGGFFDPTEYPPASGGILADIPTLSQLAVLLPSPFVRSIDHAIATVRYADTITFLGEITSASPLYYLWTAMVKFPVPLLVLLALSLGAPRLATPFQPTFRWLFSATLLVPLLYLTFLFGAQGGVRELLPVFPLLVLFAVRPVARLWAAGLAPRGFLIGLAVWMFAGVLGNWPYMIGAHNEFGGSRPYLRFGDTNIDSQLSPMDDPARTTLRKRHANASQLHFHSGPRFGTALVYSLDLWPSPRGRHGRVDQWMRDYEPIDREGPFLVFRFSEATFRLAMLGPDRARAARARRHLAIAELGAGNLRSVDGILADGGEDLPVVRAQLEALRAPVPDHRGILERWRSLGRHDLVVQYPYATKEDVGGSYHLLGRYKDCRRILEPVMRKRKLTRTELSLLCSAQLMDNAIPAAIQTLKSQTPPVESSFHAHHVELTKNLERRWGRYAKLLEQLAAKKKASSGR